MDTKEKLFVFCLIILLIVLIIIRPETCTEQFIY